MNVVDAAVIAADVVGSIPLAPDESAETQVIRDGIRMQELLNDGLIAAAFKTVEDQYRAEFRLAMTEELRRQAWLKTKVLEDIATRLRATCDAGKLADAVRKNREAARERQIRANRPR